MDKYLLHPTVKLKQAMEALDAIKGVGFVIIGEEKELLGTLTDGDIRRGLLKGITLEDQVKDAMNTTPTFVSYGASTSELEALTADQFIKIIPIVKGKEVIDVFVAELKEVSEVPVVLMAGGLGTRLGKFTKDCPKPMLKVGGKPVLERILENFTRVGFKKFYLSVNYKAEVIEKYFENGSKFSCEIKYLREKQRLGTAGALSLLPDDIQEPFVVMNGDLLTPIDFRRLIAFHKHHDSPITMSTRAYEFQVPYGVINIDRGLASSFDEKPIQRFSVNAGVYVLEPSLLKFVPKNEYFDMSHLLHKLLSEGIKANCFPMIEQWIDIGQVEDLNLAREKFNEF